MERRQYKTTSLLDRQCFENGGNWLALSVQLGTAERTARNIISKYQATVQEEAGEIYLTVYVLS